MIASPAEKGVFFEPKTINCRRGFLCRRLYRLEGKHRSCQRNGNGNM